MKYNDVRMIKILTSTSVSRLFSFLFVSVFVAFVFFVGFGFPVFLPFSLFFAILETTRAIAQN